MNEQVDCGFTGWRLGTKLRRPFHVHKPASFINEKTTIKNCNYRNVKGSVCPKLFFFFCRILPFSAWLNEDDAPIAVRMNSYLRALLGMGTSDTDEEAEAYQVSVVFIKELLWSVP